MEIVYFDTESLEEKHEDPWGGKLISIQIREKGETRIWKEWELGEKEVIDGFFDYLNSIVRKKRIFIGWACTRKDVPYLNIRMRETNTWTKKRYKILFSWLTWVDLYYIFGAEFVKFRDIARKFRLEDWKGRHASRLYREGNYEEVIRYIETEMETMEKVHEALRETKLYEELNTLRDQVSYDLVKKRLVL